MLAVVLSSPAPQECCPCMQSMEAADTIFQRGRQIAKASDGTLKITSCVRGHHPQCGRLRNGLQRGMKSFLWRRQSCIASSSGVGGGAN